MRHHQSQCRSALRGGRDIHTHVVAFNIEMLPTWTIDVMYGTAQALSAETMVSNFVLAIQTA